MKKKGEIAKRDAIIDELKEEDKHSPAAGELFFEQSYERDKIKQQLETNRLNSRNLFKNEILRGLTNQAREEIEEDAGLYPREIPILKRLVEAIDTQTVAQLAQTLAQIKAEVDALSWPIPTILPTLVDMLSDDLAGKPSQVECPTCGGTIPVIKMDQRIAGRYTGRNCGNDVVLSDETKETD
jgi:hypothetical protein